MQQNQIDRLRKDSQDLKHYIHKLNKKGKQDLAYKFLKKQNFVEQQIKELQELQ